MSDVNNIESANKFYSILKTVMQVPGVKINRSDFLKKELKTKFNDEIVLNAIDNNPAYAGISIEEINTISKNCINFETNKVSAISTITGLPGGLAMIGTIPADITQYFAHILRILQKLMYLYGWSEINSANDDLDDGTANILTLFMGVMFGVNGANKAVTKIAVSASAKMQKTLVAKGLTKGTVYPVVKKVASVLGFKMTTQSFAKSASKVVPVVGGVVSGTLTYVTFKPSSIKLRKHLETLPIANPDNYSKDIEFVDVDYEEM